MVIWLVSEYSRDVVSLELAYPFAVYALSCIFYGVISYVSVLS